MIRTLLLFAILSGAVAALSVLAMRVVLPACDVRPAGLGICPTSEVVVSTGIADALAERRALADRIAALQLDLAQRQCPIEEAAQARSAAEPGYIDSEAWEDRDVSLLEGCWELDSDLSFIDRVTNELREAEGWNMCFDAQGNGSQTLSLAGDVTCSSDRVSAAFDASGDLVIRDNADLECSDNTYVFERIITCALAVDGTAACQSRQPETGSQSSLSLRR
jgi:hypothetical protein